MDNRSLKRSIRLRNFMKPWIINALIMLAMLYFPCIYAFLRRTGRQRLSSYCPTNVKNMIWGLL